MRQRLTWDVALNDRTWTAIGRVPSQYEPVARFASTSLLRLARRVVSFQRQWDR